MNNDQIHHANLFYEGMNFAVIEYERQVNILNVTDPHHPCAIKRLEIKDGMTKLDMIRASCDALETWFKEIN